GAAGKDVYDTTLPWWRAAIRRRLVRAVRSESEIIARMQKIIRTPWLDAYFVYTSSLGTHTFFMIILPSLFFFGHDEMGRGLLIVLALGVYFSSVIKDLLCSPRPFAPPVTRLTIGSHHLEYGFPSTHSTNSVSIALFFYSQVYSLSQPDPITGLAAISPGTYHTLSAVLGVYACSIVFGRLYTAMHSFTDVAMGITLGTAIWWAHSSFAGIPLQFVLSVLGARVEAWIQTGGVEVPLILVPLTLFAIHVHPQPVDDCPCFEDAIAFVSVVLGALVSRWAISWGYGQAGVERPVVVMSGSVERGWEDVVVWWGMATLKMVVGILIIFIWRILAKSLLHLILPPIFRAVAKITGALPNRRFYTPATEYHSVPMSSSAGLHPIPSVIDLVGSNSIREEVGGIGSGVESVSVKRQPVGKVKGDLKLRGAGSASSASSGGSGNERKEIKHYDADVLTKFVVYAGIAILAAEVIPLMFDLLGWGTKSW
ncbi:PAP2 superfamily-domain-containing protein, partial [Panaeolus papilionaceus]